MAKPAFAAAATAIPINVTPTGATGHVSGIAVNPYNDKEVLVSYSNYGVPSVWYTADASVATPTWVNVEGAAGTAVELASARSVDIVQAGSTVLYLVGTSTGLYGTTALSGATTVWERVGASDIALSPVISLRLRASDNKMCVGTHGNGLFMLSFPSSALPLDLLSFEAIKVQTKAELKWTAANEVNFSHYNVQKSDDGKYFTSFAKVAAKSARVYQAINENPSVGQNYYRLEMVDTDGKKQYSKVLSLVFGSKDNKIAVYPNPSSDNTVTLDATFDQNTDVHITWTDIAGRARLTKQQTILQGTNQIAVDISTLENGVYFITTRNAATNDVIRTIRFFKQ